ncbi:All-trans-zeta-carotene desaturase [Altererythrobacter insulae]|nr:All-trans-zeta-carotene desaturase [Altererythrobacter insulae]
MNALTSDVVVIGAGIGGLSSAALLAARGYQVTLVEKEHWAGGKARSVDVDGARVDGGPTVFTLRDVFDGIFRSAGAELDDFVTMRRAQILARHAWDDAGHLDLFADPARSEQAIGEFAGAKSAAGYRQFREESRKIYNSLNDTMMRAPKPATPFSLIWRMGLSNMGDFAGKHPYISLWKALDEFFPDQRLRQLFARYSTYCGSSPFDAPATLMLIAHVEAMGVWLIDGGIAALADALKKLGEANGAQYRFGQTVEQIEIERGKATGIILSGGERIGAQTVICNADPSAIGNGLFGDRPAKAVAATTPSNRSLSAFVWYANAKTSGFPLRRHNVFFSPEYAQEFSDIADGKAPSDPTAYVCAQDRDTLAEGGQSAPPQDRERLQIIVNAPANGDTHIYSSEEIERCTLAMRTSLSRCGLELEDPLPHRLATPNAFETLWPSTGGALYGRATRGWAASFLRQGSKTKIPGLYCAGGSTHPGAGVPMAALSGQLAANTVMQDLASMKKSHRVGMAGGISTRSARIGDMG